MTESPSAAAQRLLVQAAEALVEVTESGSDVELVALLSTCETVVRRLDRATVKAWLINAWRVAGRRCRQAGVGIAGIQGWSVSASRNAVILSMPCLAAVET